MAKIQATMSTEIALDMLQASDSIKRITQLVNSATSAWKAQEAQLKSAGDTLGAAQAKYDGLGDAIKRQQAKIESLKREQSDLKGNTAETAEQYLKYQRQIDQATAKLASMESQQQKAKSSVDYYKSGLASLQQQFKQQNEAFGTYIKRLQAEGRESEVNAEKSKHLKSSIENLTKQYKIQEDMLQKVADKSGKTSSEYLLQKKRLDETATSLAHAKTNMDKLNDEIAESERNSSLIHRLKDSFVGLNKKVDDTADKTSRLKGVFSATFAANVIGDGFQAVLGNIKGKFDELISSSGEYVKYQQTMNATWLTLTGNAEDGKKMVDMTNQMAQAAANSTEMVDGMNQKLYAVTHNVDATKAQTQAILTLQDAFGQTDAAVDNFTTQWAQMIANGKVQGQDMMSIINVFPEMKNQLKEVAAETYGISDMTSEKYQELQSKGMITADMAQKALLEMQDKYKDATSNFSSTIGGMQRTLESRMPAIIGAFREPIDKMKNPFLGKISDWVADPSTEKKFSSLGFKVAKGLSTITNAFAKVFNLGDGTDKLNSFMDKLGDFVEKTSNKIAKNAPKIVETFKEVKSSLGSLIEIGKAFGEGAWEAIKGIIEGIASAFGKIGKNSKNSKEPIKNVSGALGEIAKHKDAIKTIGKLFVGYFAAKKVASGISAVVKGIQGVSQGFGILKTAGSFLMANPFVLAIAGITALVAGFVLLYKHNKKFRDFCNGIAKSVKDGIGSGIKWLKDKFDSMSKGWKKFKRSISDGTDNVVKSIKNGAKKVGNFFLGVGKTIKNVLTTIGKILIFANPVVLGFALMYKESAKFRKFVKGIVGFVGDLKDGISKKTKEIKKDWDKHWDKTKEKASKTWDGIKDNAKESTEKLAKTIREKHDEIHDKWSKTWNKSKNYLSDKWDEINDDSKKKFGKDFKGLLFDNLDKIGNKFQDIWNSIKDGFGNMWDGLKQLAGDGINAVIKIPNDGIDGINDLIHDFGGPKESIKKIPKVKFANGTGFFNGYRNAITRPTLATLNDGHDSPETNNQEMVILPNGKAVLPQGRNAQMLLPAGSEVLNASELAMLAGLNNRQAFAKGTGFWSKIWNTATNVAGSAWNGLKDGVDKFTKMLSFITGAVTDPAGTLAKKFNPNSDGLDGMFKHLGNALYKKPVENAKNWWKELWSMANEKASPEVQAGAIGDDYQFKNRGADSGADPWGYFFKECVSFVASRLSNQGVNASLFSGLGNGNMWLNARVPHSGTPRPGTVAVYAKNGQNHVSTVSGVSGNTFSGEEYNYAGSHAYHAFAGRPISMADTFLDFGVHVADKAKEENSPLRKLIKGQVGGMFDWIAKMLAPLNMASGLDNPQGGSVERWRSYVERALKANGIEPTAFRASKILATIQRESNGDPNAINNWDSNAMAGHPSIGLMQTIGPTFEAYKHAGHNNIRNGYDNLLAAINYIKHRYGTSDAAFNRVASYGYANGGLVSKNGVYELAEGNMPEYVIPTDIAKRGRAWQLLSEAVARFAGESPAERQTGTSESSLAKLEAKFDTVIGLLTQLVANGANPVEVRNIIDGQSISNGLAPYMHTATNNYERRQALLGGEII
ncbi:tail length tape-measure protein [Streptococcus phage Javan288]|uniref:tape measure protein n=2 Tax=Streptococcus macedonicus TaxID=59310 RepID=UPI0004D999CF|nr:tape measure protein [Streptococcus macedonicus]KEH52385.1 transglycosylase [Streptococcus macedonicus]QBX26042.1 tail length tape-measure protein [Streptococcus phage Javan288]